MRAQWNELRVIRFVIFHTRKQSQSFTRIRGQKAWHAARQLLKMEQNRAWNIKKTKQHIIR